MTDPAKDRTHSATGRVISTLTQHIARCGQDAGVDVDAVATRAGLSKELLAGRWIPVEIHGRFYSGILEATEDRLLSLSIGATLPMGVFESIVPLMHVSQTVGDAVQHFVRLQALMVSGARIFWDVSPAQDRVGVDIWVKEHLHELMFGGIAAHWCNLLGSLSGGAVVPQRINLPATVDDLRADYERHFGCEVHFGQSAVEVHFPCGSFAQPCITPNASIEEVLLKHGLKSMADKDGFPSQVVDMLLVLHCANARALDVAKLLGVSERTLHRRLKASNIQFQQLLDEVLVLSAKNALLSSTFNIDQIALELGYSDRRAFHRAFVRWTGQTPAQWRTSQN